MLKDLFDGLLSIFVILSIAFLVIGNIYQFAYWIKRHKIKKDIGMQYFYLDFWDNEWGTECIKEEIQNLKELNCCHSWLFPTSGLTLPYRLRFFIDCRLSITPHQFQK